SWDVASSGVGSGWELDLGGNGGIKTEAGEFVVKGKSAEVVMEYSLAFLQLYREEAFYLERTVHYLQRVGMDHIKKAVLNDAERRKALHQRLLFSLSFEQRSEERRVGKECRFRWWTYVSEEKIRATLDQTYAQSGRSW